MSRLALGTVQFGMHYGIANQLGQVTRSEVKAMLQLAATNRIDMLDTAITYGDSEACLGAVGTEGFNIVSKLPSVPDGCADVCGWAEAQIVASLTRLGRQALYGLLLHRPEQLFAPTGKELFQALQQLKDKGLVKKLGVSIYSPTELEAITRLFRIDLVQAPFNLVDDRLHTSGWLKRLKDGGVEVHTRSAFLQGLLLIPHTAMPAKFSQWSPLWQRWYGWLADHDVSAVQAALAFPLSFSEIDRVVVGVDSVSQLTELIDVANSALLTDLPDLHSEDENLINPSCWPKL